MSISARKQYFPAETQYRKMQRTREQLQNYDEAMDTIRKNSDWGRVLERQGGKGRGGVGADTSKKGMKELALVVLDMQRDIKKIADAQSYVGAQRIAEKWGNGHRAAHEDYNDDGITDILIYDKYDNPVVVNGYTTKQSKWPMQNAYFTAAPTKADRQALKYDKWYEKAFAPLYTNPEDPYELTSQSTPEWADKARKAGYAVSTPRNRSTYQVFSSSIFKLIYQEWCDAKAKEYIAGSEQLMAESKKYPGAYDDILNNVLKPYKKAFISIAAYAWQWVVLAVVIQKVYTKSALTLLKRSVGIGSALSASEEVILKKMKNSKAVKEGCADLVKFLWRNTTHERTTALFNGVIERGVAYVQTAKEERTYGGTEGAIDTLIESVLDFYVSGGVEALQPQQGQPPRAASATAGMMNHPQGDVPQGARVLDDLMNRPQAFVKGGGGG